MGKGSLGSGCHTGMRLGGVNLRHRKGIASVLQCDKLTITLFVKKQTNTQKPDFTQGPTGRERT